jgi:hypothetical protein
METERGQRPSDGPRSVQTVLDRGVWRHVRLMSVVQPRNPAEPTRNGLHDATQMCEQVVTAPVQPLRQNASAVRPVRATNASLPQGELCEH